MIKKFIPGIILLFSFLHACSQNPKLSGALTIPGDTASIRKWVAYAITLHGKNNQKAIELYKYILYQSEKLHFDYGMGCAWLNFGLFKMWEGDYLECMKDVKVA